MPHAAPSSDQTALQALRHKMRVADDQAITRITALLDGVSDTTANQTILDPIRARLGALKPARPLRFARLLATPLDPLIVPANKWRPGEAAVPRTALASISGVVRAGLGPQAAVIDKMIFGHKIDAKQIVSVAGDALWHRAGDILTASSPPADWSQTGLPPGLYSPLVKAIAAVLRRASQLRCLLRDGQAAAISTDQETIDRILVNIANETPEGCTMILQLILLQSPHATQMLRQFVASRQSSAEWPMLQQAMARATEQSLTQMESPAEFMNEITQAPLAGMGEHVQRVATFLKEIVSESGAPPAHRSRVKAIRERLDQACRARFAEGVAEGIVLPLSATSEVNGEAQTQMEKNARDLRTLEMVARKVGGSGSYDRLLTEASESVQAAAQSGTLTPVRMLRLIEILSGSDVAAAMYRKERPAPVAG